LSCYQEDLGVFKAIKPDGFKEGTKVVQTGNFITAAIDHSGTLKIWHNYPRFKAENIIEFYG